jgi:FixJ family two-component response regulator
MDLCQGWHDDKGSIVPAKNAVSVVEDDESVRLALVGLIRSVGHEARGFASAEEYLALQDGRCACVITDLHMPGINGIEMMLKLREMGYSVPTIMITARAERTIEERAMTAGALCVLRKPFEAQALLDCLQRALAKGASSH